VPTYDALSGFRREFAKLDPAMQAAFRRAVAELVTDLNEGRNPRPGLRLRMMEGHRGVFEMTFAPDGRATFHLGTAIRPGQLHIVWRRIGAHEIFRDP
jgi:hypothetical protein